MATVLNVYIQLSFAISSDFLDALNKGVWRGLLFDFLLGCPGMRGVLMLKLQRLSVDSTEPQATKCHSFAINRPESLSTEICY